MAFHRRPARAGLLAAAILGCITTASCTPPFIPPGAPPVISPLREALLLEARRNYTFEGEQVSEPVDLAGLGPDRPVRGLTAIAWTMRRRTGIPGPEPYRFVGRFYTNKAYPRLGFAAGFNYIWRRNPTGPTPNYVVVPDDQDAPMRNLLLPSTERTVSPIQHGAPRPVHAVTSNSSIVTMSRVMGICVEGPCTANHCVISDAGTELIQ